MNQILQGKPMTVFGDGSQTRAFSYIGDIAPILAEAIDVPAARNQIFNLGRSTLYGQRIGAMCSSRHGRRARGASSAGP